MITYIKGNLFELISLATEPNILISHVTNNRGGWGSGFVIPLGQKYPSAKKAYLDNKSRALGQILVVPVDYGPEGKGDKKITVCHMCAQDGFATPDRPRALNYHALITCMSQVAEQCLKYKYDIYAPMFGSGLAGGNWDFIEELIKDVWINNKINVTICQL